MDPNPQISWKPMNLKEAMQDTPAARSPYVSFAQGPRASRSYQLTTVLQLTSFPDPKAALRDSNSGTYHCFLGGPQESGRWRLPQGSPREPLWHTGTNFCRNVKQDFPWPSHRERAECSHRGPLKPKCGLRSLGEDSDACASGVFAAEGCLS